MISPAWANASASSASSVTQWAQSWAFLGCGLMLIVAVLTWWLGKRWHGSLQFSRIPSAQFVSLRASLVQLPRLLMLGALVFAWIALARPQAVDTQSRRLMDGIDIMIALDISDSMLIEDMKPFNRLEAAKDTIEKFVQGRNSDRIGLIVFAGESFTMVPLTLDYPLILQRIKEIETAQKARIKDGTAIGVALANAVGRLKDSKAKSKVVIFMTDGENNSGTIDPETGLEIAKQFGVKIYSIGIGRDGPTQIPIYRRDLFGNEVKTYQPFESTVNENLLGRFASETGGRFFRASDEDSLPKVFSQINRLEKTEQELSQFVRTSELFPSFLRWAVLLYLLGWLLQWSWLRRSP